MLTCVAVGIFVFGRKHHTEPVKYRSVTTVRVAEKVKVDPQDNIWVVDQMSNTVMEFDAEGRLVMLLGRKAESENVPVRGAAPPAAPGGGPNGGAASGGRASSGAAPCCTSCT